jgi:hypothetical protein
MIKCSVCEKPIEDCKCSFRDKKEDKMVNPENEKKPGNKKVVTK